MSLQWQTVRYIANRLSEHWRVVETQRLTRTQFERWFANRDISLVVMESCGSAHHWARWQ